MARSSGSKKLGQPVPLSNLRPVAKSAWTAARAGEGARPVLLQEGAGPRRLGAVAAQHGILLWRQIAAPFLV